jgi:acyl-coenzyme A synthetase/AMP-(fatty) acid ligase
MKNIDKFIQKFSDFDDQIALIFCNELITYSTLLNEVNLWSNKIINLKIRHGEIVFILGDYSLESISLFLSLAMNGNIIVPITSINGEEIKERIEVVKPNWILNLRNGEDVFFEDNKDFLNHEIINSLIKLNTSGLILFSSGSTGKPKAMVHNLDTLLLNYIDRKGKNLNFLVFLMFDHIGGLNTLFNCLAMGSTITVPQNRNPHDIATLIQTHNVNILPASPTFLNLLLISGVFEKFDFSSIKMITYGTETMPEGLLIKLKGKLPHVKFLQTFGTSETGIFKTTSMSSSSTFLKFDDPNQEFKIVEGELWLKSKTQVMGYINHSNESFTDDGWFKTGDLIEQNKDGYIKIIGRSKEIINVGGEKVFPAEVESIIIQIESVQDCVVRAEKNVITGQMVCADIVLMDGFDFKEEKRKIKNFCINKLDSFKVPVRITQVQSVLYTDRFKKNRQI